LTRKDLFKERFLTSKFVRSKFKPVLNIWTKNQEIEFF